MNEKSISYIASTISTVMPTTHATPAMPARRLERVRERLWLRVLQAKRQGARFAIIDLYTLEIAIAPKCDDPLGEDGDIAPK